VGGEWNQPEDLYRRLESGVATVISGSTAAEHWTKDFLGMSQQRWFMNESPEGYCSLRNSANTE